MFRSLFVVVVVVAVVVVVVAAVVVVVVVCVVVAVAVVLSFVTPSLELPSLVGDVTARARPLLCVAAGQGSGEVRYISHLSMFLSRCLC